MPPTDTAVPGQKPARSNSRKRIRRPTPTTVNNTATSSSSSSSSSSNNNNISRAQQIHAYYDLKHHSPALRAARMTRTKRLNAARWAAAQAAIPVQWRAFMVIARVLIMSLVLFIMFKIMLKEKQLLAVKNALTLKGGSGSSVMMEQKMDWKTFQHAYETRFQRPTPSGYQQWLKFAQSEACEPFKLYNAIERDLLPFRYRQQQQQQQVDENNNNNNNNNKLWKWNQLQDMATNYTKGAYLLVEIQNHQITIVREDLTEWYAQHPLQPKPNSWRAYMEARKLKFNLQWLFDPIIHHEPPLHLRFVINLHHQPRLPKTITPPSASAPVVPIFSFHHDARHTDNDPVHPGQMALQISNKNRNGIIDPRDSSTAPPKDLLLPHLYVSGGRMGAAGMTSSPSIGGFWFWPFFRQGKPWKHRKPTIVWRGSTLGNYHHAVHSNNNNKNNNNNNNSATYNSKTAVDDFFTGPRFEMMNKWANINNNNKNVHPIADNVNVNVDFAFTKLILPNHIDKMHPTIRNQIEQRAYDTYRFDKPFRYGTLQQYQYLMDVDSNGTYTHFILICFKYMLPTNQWMDWVCVCVCQVL